MFGESLLSSSFTVGALVAGFVVGVIATRLLGSIGNRPMGKRADDLHHRIRGLEADLRVAHRTSDDLKSERDALTTELAKSTARLAVLDEQSADHADVVRKLKAAVQHECAKTAQLRVELADRAEEMVKTHVQLRDVQTELGVSQVGSSVDTDQMVRLERERNDMTSTVQALRKEVAALRRAKGGSATQVTLDGNDDLLVDC